MIEYLYALVLIIKVNLRWYYWWDRDWYKLDVAVTIKSHRTVSLLTLHFR